MRDLYVRDIIEKCNGKLLYGDMDLVLDNFSKDSREVKNGDVYLGIRGEVFDGNTFYKEAFDKGASVCILDNKDIDISLYEDKTIVMVEDTVKCIQELARYKRSLFDENMPVIAVTGSVGKTSTKDMIYSVVSQKYKTYKTMGNYNNHIGVPLTILGLRDEEAIIVEMGMNHLGEISVLTEIAKPTMAVITNVGTAHIGILGSRDNILKAKLEILEGLDKDGVLFINNDNDMLHGKYLELSDKYEVVTIGIENDSDYQALDIEDKIFGSKFKIGKDKVEVEVGGDAFIYNALMAYAIGDKLGIDKSKIKKGIADFKLSSHRLEKKINKRGTVIIDDTYNANFDSMKGAIELLGKVRDKRRIAILGDMLELGEYTEKLHTDIGEVVCDNKLDMLITVGEYSRYIADRAIELGFIQDYIYGFDKEDECYDLLDVLLTDKDIVLVKGSHGIHLVNVVDKIMDME